MLINKLKQKSLVNLLVSTTLGGLLTFASGCANATEDPPKDKESQSFSGSYLSGMFAKKHGLDSDASSYLNSALNSAPDNLQVQLLSFRLELANGRMEKAVELAKTLVDKGNKDPLVTLILTAESIRLGQYAEAEARLAKFDNKGFNEVLTPIMSSWVRLGKGEKGSPFELDSVIEKTAGSPSFVYFQLGLMNDLAGFKDEALAAYLKAYSSSPQPPYRVVLALGNYYERNGRKDDADKLYQSYMEQALSSVMGNDTEVFTAQRTDPTKPLVGSVQDGVSELFSVLAGMFYTESSSQESLYYLRLALFLKPDAPATQLMLGDVLAEKDEREQADAVYESIDHASYYYRQGQIKKAFNLDAMGKTNEALKLLEELAASKKEDFEPYLTKGDILRDKKKFAEAADAYTQSIERVKTPGKQHWPLYYVRGICFERAGKWESAEADFKKALELEPNQPEVLNYLGYSWLIMGRNVDKAKEMIETAIAARPDDAHIIDSMGWALYSLGEYDGAIGYLEQAVEIKPHDPTINDHLGDAYWRVGRKLEAKFQWERALSFDPESKEIEQIKLKLQSGLPEAKKQGGEQAAADDGKDSKNKN